MKINFSKYQNRREFLTSSGRKGLTIALGFIGIPFVNKNLLAGEGKNCPENINCQDCFKMGVCKKIEAVETRIKIKTNGHTAKISKGAKNG